MKPPTRALYLERELYRRRRIMDAARLWPVLGVFLVALPMLWQSADGPEAGTAWQGIYLFAVWMLLILGAWVLSRALMPEIDGQGTSAPGGGVDGEEAAAPSTGRESRQSTG